MKTVMAKIYKIQIDADVNRDQLFADSSSSEARDHQVQLVPLGSNRTRNFFAEPPNKLWKPSPWGAEDAKLRHGHKNCVDKYIEEKSIQDLHTVMLPLASDINEKLGLGM